MEEDKVEKVTTSGAELDREVPETTAGPEKSDEKVCERKKSLKFLESISM